MKLLSLLSLLALVALTHAVGVEDGAFVSSGFDYCGGATGGAWASGDCATDQQSPIVLPPLTGATAPANAIAYTPSVGTNCNVENNGHTLKWACAAGSMGSFSFRNTVFNIKQFHVHFPAEHKFGTETKAGEVHFVAYRQGANEAQLARGDVIALGAMVNRVQCPATPPSALFGAVKMRAAPENAQSCARAKAPAPGGASAAAKGTLAPSAAPTSPAAARPVAAKMMFRELIKTLTRINPHSGAAPILQVGNIDLTATMGSLSGSSTAQYEGSLTTPPCSRVVTHVVIVDKYLSACGEDIDFFLNSQVGANARPIQSAGSRVPVYGAFTARTGSSSAPPTPGTPTVTPTAAAPTAAAPTAPAPVANQQKIVSPK